MATTYVTTIDKKKKTITTYELTDDVVEKIKDMLAIFTPDPNVEYSLGFRRYESLSRSKQFYLQFVFEREGLGFQKLKKFLENFSEKDFKEFKKGLPNFKNISEVKKYLTQKYLK